MTMPIKDYVLTVVRCFRASISGERRLAGLLLLMFGMSLMFGLMMGLVTVAASKSAPPSSSLQPTFAAQAANSVLRSLFAKSKEQDRSTPLSGAQVWIQAPDQETRQLGQAMVVFAGGGVATEPGQANVQIQWNDQKNEWVVSSLRADAQELAVFAWFGLRHTANEFRIVQGVDLPDPNAAIIFLENEPSKAEGGDSARQVLALAIMLCVFGPSLGALFGATGMLSLDLDRERAAGALEAFVNVKHPLSSMFLGRAMARAIAPTLMFVVSICVAGLFLGFPEPGVALLMVVGMCLAGVCLGMIGQVQVVWYHHVYSRIVGQLLFNPATFALMFLIFAGDRLIKGMSNVSDRAGQTGGKIPIIEWSTADLLPLVGAGGVASVVLITLLCLMIDWRLGIRRQGLARVI